MKTLVVYYSRDGSTRKVAQSIARELSADLEEVKSQKPYSGFLGYFRAVYDSLNGRLPSVEPPTMVPCDYDLVVVGSPLWAGHASTPTRAFLKNCGSELRRAALFVTYGGSSPARAIAEMAELVERQPEAVFTCRTKSIADGTFETSLSEFILKLKPPLAA